VSDPPPNSPHNAETVADDGPRWPLATLVFVQHKLRFLGRAGPLDIWLDPNDPSVPFLVVRSVREGNWSPDAELVIMRAKDERVHLTLHDTCMIHTLCAPHNPTQPKETHHD
jgi:hypothetical protein